MSKWFVKNRNLLEKNPLEHNYFLTFFESRNRKIENKKLTMSSHFNYRFLCRQFLKKMTENF